MKAYIIQNNRSREFIPTFIKIERKTKMRILCGTDIIEIERIKKSIERSGEHFLDSSSPSSSSFSVYNFIYISFIFVHYIYCLFIYLYIDSGLPIHTIIQF